MSSLASAEELDLLGVLDGVVEQTNTVVTDVVAPVTTQVVVPVVQTVTAPDEHVVAPVTQTIQPVADVSAAIADPVQSDLDGGFVTEPRQPIADTVIEPLAGVTAPATEMVEPVEMETDTATNNDESTSVESLQSVPAANAETGPAIEPAAPSQPVGGLVGGLLNGVDSLVGDVTGGLLTQQNAADPGSPAATSEIEEPVTAAAAVETSGIEETDAAPTAAANPILPIGGVVGGVLDGVGGLVGGVTGGLLPQDNATRDEATNGTAPLTGAVEDVVGQVAGEDSLVGGLATTLLAPVQPILGSTEAPATMSLNATAATAPVGGLTDGLVGNVVGVVDNLLADVTGQESLVGDLTVTVLDPVQPVLGLTESPMIAATAAADPVGGLTNSLVG
ncbi:MAG: hypothetical protein ACRDJW_10290, partial [Thermomicrobiales bacterium]